MRKRLFAYIMILYLIELLLLAFIMVNYHSKNHALKDGTVYSFNDGWTLSIGNVKYENQTLPVKYNSDSYSEIIMENTIPKEYEGLTMYFLTTDKSFRFFVDDECIYEFGINEYSPFGEAPGAMMHYIDLPNNISEGNLRIEMISPFENIGSVFTSVNIARRDVAVLQLVSNNVFEVLCSFLLFTFACVLTMTGILNKLSHMPTEGTFFMALFSMTSSFYYLIQSRLLYIFYGNVIAYIQVNFAFLMLMPIWLSAYYLENMPKRFSRYPKIVIVFGFINVFLQQILNWLGIFEYREMMTVSHGLAGIAGVIFSACYIHALVKKEDIRKNLCCLIFLIINLSGSIFDISRAYKVISADMGKYSRITSTISCVGISIYHITNYIKRNNKKLEDSARLLQHENEKLMVAKNEADEARLDAIRANSAKNNFLARISHEIRTPINAVLGMDNMILRESTDDNIKNYAMDIKNASSTLLSLINDILDFSKMESGNLEILPTEYDISSVLHDIINMTEPRLKAKNLKFNCNIDENIPSRLYGDDVRVRQIIINILTNAVKYTEEGSVTFTVKSKPAASDRVILCVDVTDTGIGIKEEDLENITVAFKRIEESRNRHIEGTGLGMNITVSLLSMMNSSLNIKSEYGVGSSFSFELEQKIMDVTPIGKFQERFEKQAVEFKYTTSVYAPDANILVVDDNSMNLKVFKGLLKHTGVNITDLDSGYEALSTVTQEHFDIIFLDHMMPGMDGIETLQKMNKMDHKCKDTPKIVLTANAVVGAKEMYLENGFTDFLSKPIIPEKLEHMLLTYLPKELLKEVKTVQQEPQAVNVDDFPLVEGIDWKYAAEHFTETEFLQEAVDNLYNTIETDMATLNKYYDDIENEDSLNEYRIKVHAMKSTTNVIGAMSLSGIARVLEYAARDKEIDTIKSLSPIFIKECQKLKDNLDAVRPKVDKEKVDTSLLITLLNQLKKKVTELDLDAMDDIVAELNKYELPDMEEEMKKLLNDASNIDMEAVVADADNMLSKLG